MSAQPRVMVVGCGGIGGTLSAGLIRQGLEVVPLTRNELIADAINAHGFRTRGESSLGTVPARAFTKVPKGAKFDYILLATQPPQVEEAARSVKNQLADDGAMVVFQNGICEPRIAAIAGRDRVIGGIVAWGATMVEPGIYDRTSSGGFTLGRIEGEPDEKTRALALHLEAIGPVTTSDNLMGARWSKLAINCAISSLGTVGGDRLGPLMRKRWVRRLTLEVMSEVCEVARAEGVALQKVAGTIDLDWLELTESERQAKVGSPGLLAKHTLLIAVGTRYRRLRSSMLNAIERGREPAVDFLNGEVVARARRHALRAPVNEALQRAVKDISAGRKRAAHATLEQLFRDTRSAANVAKAAPPESADEPTLEDATSAEGSAPVELAPAQPEGQDPARSAQSTHEDDRAV